MDVIKFVLWATTKLTLAVTGIAVAAVVFLVEKLTGHVPKKTRQDVSQQEAQPLPQQMPQPPTYTPPPVHVHVHIDQAQTPIGYQPAPQSTPSPLPAAPLPAWILKHPDHRIYVTTGSHLMQEHPACDDLLNRLDEILYIAAHRHGEPFTVAPPLDDQRNSQAVPLDLPPVAPVDDTEFLSDERRDLPPPDGALWFRKAGESPRQIAPGTPS